LQFIWHYIGVVEKDVSFFGAPRISVVLRRVVSCRRLLIGAQSTPKSVSFQSINQSLLRQKAAHGETHNKMLRQEEKKQYKSQPLRLTRVRH